MSKTLKTRITQKFDTVENWQASTLPLLKGELAIDNLNRIKIGVDGQKTWSEILTFAVDPTAIKPAVQALASLPEPTSQDFVPGNLVLTNDGKLWCLVEVPAEDPEAPAERSWVDLTNNAEIKALRSDVDGLEGGLVALKQAVDAKDEAHDAAIVALQAAMSSDVEAEVEAIQLALANHDERIIANGQKIDSILEPDDDDPNTPSKIKVSALPEAIYVDGKINSAALPSFVDDVVEGIVCLGTDANEQTYALTHTGDTVTGFFIASGAEAEGSERELSYVTTKKATDDDIKDVDLGSLPHVVNGITYKFPQKPAEAIIAPSSSAIYVDVTTNKTYRWSGNQFVVIAGDLALGETASSAFYGDRGVALEEAVFGVENDPDKPGLETKVADLQQALADEIEDRDAAVKAEADLREAADKAHEAALAVLANKHTELEQEVASSIVALKEESEASDKAHEAALAVLQQQIATTAAETANVTFNDVIGNSENVLNDDVILIDCGGASAD